MMFVEMADLDWRDLITVDPQVVTGKPVVRGTRLSVDFVVDLLAGGNSEDEILRNYPGLTREAIRACLAYAGDRLRAEKVYPIRA
jgi:uncharacterized protein (DUF433 family)